MDLPELDAADRRWLAVEYALVALIGDGPQEAYHLLRDLDGLDAVTDSGHPDAAPLGDALADLVAAGGPAVPTYQPKIALTRVRPPVRRRVRMPATTTLDALHRIIQVAFDWDDDHLHVFTVDGRRYADPFFDLDDCADESRVRLGRLLTRAGGSIGYVYLLCVHPTVFALPDDADTTKPGAITSVVFGGLVADQARTDQICRDVHAALGRGRNCLVLTRQTAHVEALADRLRELGHEPHLLYATRKELKQVLAFLADPPAEGPPLLVVATDKYVGEGYDCPRLDTLFLAHPVSFKGSMVQYVGRILRNHPGKTTVEVHDYVDEAVGVLAAMDSAGYSPFRLRGRGPGVRDGWYGGDRGSRRSTRHRGG